jgi:hypothetical protein
MFLMYVGKVHLFGQYASFNKAAILCAGGGKKKGVDEG